jgi:hypothetical protein
MLPHLAIIKTGKCMMNKPHPNEQASSVFPWCFKLSLGANRVDIPVETRIGRRQCTVVWLSSRSCPVFVLLYQFGTPTGDNLGLDFHLLIKYQTI